MERLENVHVGDVLKEFLEDYYITRKTLSTDINVSKTFISEVINRKKNIIKIITI